MYFSIFPVSLPFNPNMFQGRIADRCSCYVRFEIMILISQIDV